MFCCFLFQCLFEIKKKKKKHTRKESRRDREAPPAKQTSPGFCRGPEPFPSVWSISGQAEIVGDRSRWLQAAGGCGEGGAGLAIPGQLGWAWMWRKARWTWESGAGESGRRWPHGTGGGEWFPGIWKTQEAGRAQCWLPGAQSGRESTGGAVPNPVGTRNRFHGKQLLTTCCAARFLTGHRPVPVHGPGTGDPGTRE